MSGDNIGMMEGAFFVSKGVILEWMNELLDVSIQIFVLNMKSFEIMCSFNLLKLSNVPPVQYTVKLWTQSSQVHSTLPKSNGALSLTMNTLRITKSCRVHLIRMASRDT